MNILEAIKKDESNFSGICIREGAVSLQIIKDLGVNLAYLFDIEQAKNYKQILLAGSEKERGKYFIADIVDIVNVKEIYKLNKKAVEIHENYWGKWITNAIENNINDKILEKRFAAIFKNPSEIKQFSTDWVAFNRSTFHYIEADKSIKIYDSTNEFLTIKNLKIENFINFNPLNLDFSKNINLFIGDNASGKTSLIKLLYAVFKSFEEFKNEKLKRSFKEKISIKIQKTFPSEKGISSIISNSENESLSANITFLNKNKDENIEFSFGKSTISEISNVKSSMLKDEYLFEKVDFDTIFIPSKEILSIRKSMYVFIRNYAMGYDSTNEDLLPLMEPPFFQTENFDKKLSYIYETIENNILHGKFEWDDRINDYIFIDEKGKKYELALTAEGYKQLGIIPILIKTGKLKEGTILFLDETDNNLNPEAITKYLEILVELTKLGVQIFITSHNYFVLNRLNILANMNKELNFKIFNLNKNKLDNKINIQQTDLKIIPENKILDAALMLFNDNLDYELNS